ncbi:MAG: ATP-binding cassette domain-containing protein [Bacteroidales bacterium]|nr:ATP-binding cassette domain-containing protein [Bacteroidales bacterium]
MATHTLIVDNPDIHFRRKSILTGGGLTSSTGKITGLLGNNGSGKSFLFRALMGELSAKNLALAIDGATIPRKDVCRYVKYLPQGQMIPPTIKIARAFELFGVEYPGFTRLFPEFANYHGYAANSLSGGEIRIIETYLVLMTDSMFCILDEPFTKIDPNHRDVLKDLIRKCSTERGIIVTDYDYGTISSIVDDLFLLSNGQIIPVGQHKELARYGYFRVSRTA